MALAARKIEREAAADSRKIRREEMECRKRETDIDDSVSVSKKGESSA